MKRQLRNSTRHKDEITEFHFSADKLSQLEWEDKHEFRFNGHMYDVISQEWKNGKLEIRCIADEKETSLVNHYLNIIRDHSGGKKALASLLQLIGIQFLLPSSIPERQNTVSLKMKFPSITSRLLSIAYPIQTPPPRYC
jgi:hypothetical protein